MKFTYSTATGNISIDIEENWVAILEDFDRLERNNNQTETRRHYHMEACDYEGEDYGREDPEFERFIERDSSRTILAPALASLTESQREVIDALFFKHMNAREYADSRGISEAAVSKAKAAALRKMKKVLAEG